MPDIFISYSRNDREKVRMVAEALEEVGFSVWWDPEIPPGESFADVIDRNLRGAKCVLVVWSQSSIISNWVQEEADDGMTRNALIPVMIDDIELPRGFKRLQTADLRNWKGDTKDPNWQLILGQVGKLVAARKSEAQRSAPKKAAAAGARADAVSAPTPSRPAKKSGGPMAAILGLIGVVIAGGAGYYFLSNNASGPQITADAPKQEEPEIKTGTVFRDCDSCPEMVSIAGGSVFKMGAATGERSADRAETPQIEITLARPFAIGAYEVTYDEWAVCVADGGCSAYEPADMGWGKGRRPLVNVSFNDAQSYLTWLSAKTGETYRLPSEAEWEFSARAGSEEAFAFGAGVRAAQANFDAAKYPYAGAPNERSQGKTTPVGTYAANGFGLYDMHGNVWEWTADCWRSSHLNAPTDGSPVSGSCSERVLKGGAWNAGGWRLRSAHRKGVNARDRDFDTGFRVARDLG